MNDPNENRRLRFLAIVLIATMVSSCVATSGSCVVLGERIRGSGRMASDERSISGVSEVAVTNQGDLYITLGDEERLVIEAEDNLLDYLTSEVRGGKLILGTKRGGYNIRPTKPIRYLLTVRSLEGVETSSSGDIQADRLEGDRVSVRSSSSGDIEIGFLSARSLRATLSSSGDVSISDGEVEQLDLQLSSSGDFDGHGLACRDANVTLSSSGDAKIRVSGQLDANLSSSGNLYYEGDARVESRVTSSGRIRRM